MKKDIDLLALIIDVSNYASPQMVSFIDEFTTKNDLTEKYFIDWAKTIKEKFENEVAPQWSARYYELIKNYCAAQIRKLIEEKKSLEPPQRVAKLVSFEITTRVIVNENKEMPEVEEEDAINAALEKLKKDSIEHWICFDNCTEVIEDKECPFGIFDDDK